MWSSLADKNIALLWRCLEWKIKAFSLFLLHSVSMISIFDHGMMERNRKSDISNSLDKGRETHAKRRLYLTFRYYDVKNLPLKVCTYFT